MTNQPVKNSTDQRIASLETRVESLASDVERVVTSIEHLADSTARGFRDINLGQKPQWGTLISAGALILAIVGIGAQGYIRDQGRMESSLLLLQAQQVSQAESRGKGFEQLATLYADHASLKAHVEAGLAALDDKLQREMRLLSEARNAVSDALDKKMQGEISSLGELSDAKSAALSNELRGEINVLRAQAEKKP